MRRASGRRQRTGSAVAVGLALGLGSAVAGAQWLTELPAPLVEWTAPGECPGPHSVIQRLLTVTRGGAERLARAGSVRGEIQRVDSEWVLSLEIMPAAPRDLPAVSAPRVFRAAECDDLAEVAAVAIALALGDGVVSEPSAEAPAAPARASGSPGAGAPTNHARPMAAASPSNPPSGARATPDAATASAASPPSSPRRASSEPESATGHDEGAGEPPRGADTGRLRMVASAEALVDSASLGGSALGFGAEAQLRLGELGMGIYGVGLPSRSIPLAASQSVGLSLWAAGVRACYRTHESLLTLDVCAGGELGALGAAGQGLVDATSRRDPWAAATWGGLLGMDLAARVRAGARLEAVLPLSRERYLVNGDEVVHAVPAASLRLGLAVASRFGSP